MDTDLRSLERQAEQSPEDRAAWLRARLRGGTLKPSKLLLLAYCRDPGALILEPSHGKRCPHHPARLVEDHPDAGLCGPATWCPACGECWCEVECSCANPGWGGQSKGRCFGWRASASLRDWLEGLGPWGYQVALQAWLAAADVWLAACRGCAGLFGSTQIQPSEERVPCYCAPFRAVVEAWRGAAATVTRHEHGDKVALAGLVPVHMALSAVRRRQHDERGQLLPFVTWLIDARATTGQVLEAANDAARSTEVAPETSRKEIERALSQWVLA